MKTYIYRGGFPIVEKSGVGKAIEHQEKMLNAVQATRAARWKEITLLVLILQRRFLKNGSAFVIIWGMLL